LSPFLWKPPISTSFLEINHSFILLNLCNHSSEEGGGDAGLKSSLEKIEKKLTELNDTLRGNMTQQDRLKYIALMTTEIYYRDIVLELINQKVCAIIKLL
jgi:hypothetical protein